MRINPEGREGIRINTIVFVIIIAVVTATALKYDWAWWVLALVDAFLVWRIVFFVRFFREPQRPLLREADVLFAPADGKIVVIEEVEEPDHFHDRRLMISIFMSPLNVHANWYPVDGTVKRVEHENGKYHRAFLPKASTDNERSLVVVETPDGKEVMVRQIAGAMARRIVTYAKPGEECFIDQHFGFIKLGSRVDIYLPLGTEVCVQMGQKTTGNQTVIAKLK
jgi:phosphatidylserine decarboxylase